MSTRVSTTQVYQSSLQGINEAYSRFDAAQRQVNTGKQLQKPSDDPTGIAQSLDFREKISEIDQFGRTLDQAKGFIATAEGALDTVSSLTRQARTIAVQGASDNISVEARQGLAGQLQNIITQIGNIGNTSYANRYVFAGQRTTAPPFHGQGPGFGYTGGTDATGDADVTLDIGRGESLTINATGDKVLSPLLTTLSTLRDSIAQGQSSKVSREDLADLDTKLNAVLGVRADFGAKIGRIESTKQRNELTKVNFTQFVSNIEDADIPKAVVSLQAAQTAYQAALSSTAKTFQSSLLDFLR